MCFFVYVFICLVLYVASQGRVNLVVFSSSLVWKFLYVYERYYVFGIDVGMLYNCIKLWTILLRECSFVHPHLMFFFVSRDLDISTLVPFHMDGLNVFSILNPLQTIQYFFSCRCFLNESILDGFDTTFGILILLSYWTCYNIINICFVTFAILSSSFDYLTIEDNAGQLVLQFV